MPKRPLRIEPMDPQMVEVLRNKSEVERLEISWGLWRMLRDIVRGSLRAEHPDWSAAELECAVARRMTRATS